MINSTGEIYMKDYWYLKGINTTKNSVTPNLEKLVEDMNRRKRTQKLSAFVSIPKKGTAKECSNYHIITLISNAGKIILKILQARLLQYMICELLDVQVGFSRGRGTRGQIANIFWIMDKAGEFQKKHLFLLH